MMHRAGLALVACCGALAACSSAPVVREARDAPTGIRESEQIAVLLATYGQLRGFGKTNSDVDVDRAAVERQLDACLRREMLSTHGRLRFADPQALRHAAFPGQAAGVLEAEAEALLAQLAEAKVRQHPGLHSLRYVVLLDGTQWDSGARPHASGGHGGGVLGLEWQRVLSVRATVLDLVHRRVAGSVSAYATGQRGAGVAVLIILPIPVFFTTMPEAADVCRGLGRGLARFIAQ